MLEFEFMNIDDCFLLPFLFFWVFSSRRFLLFRILSYLFSFLSPFIFLVHSEFIFLRQSAAGMMAWYDLQLHILRTWQEMLSRSGYESLHTVWATEYFSWSICSFIHSSFLNVSFLEKKISRRNSFFEPQVAAELFHSRSILIYSWMKKVSISGFLEKKKRSQ